MECSFVQVYQRIRAVKILSSSLECFFFLSAIPWLGIAASASRTFVLFVFGTSYPIMPRVVGPRITVQYIHLATPLP